MIKCGLVQEILVWNKRMIQGSKTPYFGQSSLALLFNNSLSYGVICITEKLNQIQNKMKEGLQLLATDNGFEYKKKKKVNDDGQTKVK